MSSYNDYSRYCVPLRVILCHFGPALIFYNLIVNDNAPDTVKLSPFLRALHQLRSFSQNSQNSFFPISHKSIFTNDTYLHLIFHRPFHKQLFTQISSQVWFFLIFVIFCENYIMITVIEIFTNLPKIIVGSSWLIISGTFQKSQVQSPAYGHHLYPWEFTNVFGQDSWRPKN